MRGARLVILALPALLVGAVPTVSGASKPAIGPPPSWVEAVPVPSKPPPAADDGNGIDDLLFDRQMNPAEEASYIHAARRFVNATGVERGSQLIFPWDPAYQSLTVHQVTLIRGEERIDALRPEALRVLQRESGMEFNLFDGTLTAVLVLDDLRQGDTLEYAYTRTGYNPIFGGKYLDDVAMRGTVAVEHVRSRLLWPRQRRLFRKQHGDVPTPRMTPTADVVELVWEAQPSPALLVESDLPSWFDPSPWVQLSEFETWNDVARWAVPLYERAPTDDVRALARRFAAEGKSDRDHAAAALRFVQDEIRYLGLEMGTGSHRPNPPKLVLSRRFGDCKDKALLLVALLEELGFEAWPALVHTSLAQEIDRWQPSPLAFNHVIVYARIAGTPYWLDPTRSRQGGRLDSLATPPFRRALVVADTTTALSELSEPRRGETEIHERWTVRALEEAASLVVTTRYRGPAADAMRARFASEPRDALAKSVVEFYTERFPKISVAAPLAIEDEVDENVVTLTEHYTVEDFFSKKDGRGLVAQLFPQEIHDVLPDPGHRKRTMPLGLPYPTVLSHEARIELPDDWPVTPKTRNVDTPYFRYRENASAQGNVVTLQHSWETLADSIPVEKVSDALTQVASIKEALGWELTHKGVVPAESKVSGLANLNVTLAMMTLLFFGLCVGAAFKAARWQPGAAVLETPPDPTLEGIGGWLIVVGIGMVARPFVLLASISSSFRESFQADVWMALTSPSGAAFHPLWAPVIIGEIFLNVFLLVFSVLLAALFFQRRRSLPPLVIAFLVVGFVGALADTAVGHLLPLEPDTSASSAGAVTQSTCGALIWIPYFLLSKRVKATFVR